MRFSALWPLVFPITYLVHVGEEIRGGIVPPGHVIVESVHRTLIWLLAVFTSPAKLWSDMSRLSWSAPANWPRHTATGRFFGAASRTWSLVIPEFSSFSTSAFTAATIAATCAT